MTKMLLAAMLAPMLAAVPLTGCATLPPGAAAVETIRYATSACHGVCPVYGVTVSSDGTGVFTGEAHVAVTGERRFAVTPAQFAAFKQRLAPYRPDGEAVYQPGEPRCEPAATDMPGLDVRWERRGATARHLAFYFGCGNPEARAMREGLRTAPEALPIATFIGGGRTG